MLKSGPGWRGRFQRIDKRRFLANLNVFIPLLAYGYLILEASLFAPSAPVSTPAWNATTYDSSDASPQPIVVVAWIGVLALIWMTIGLSPKGVAPGRENRHRLGQVMLGLTNLAVFSTALLPLLLANLTGIEAIGHLMWLGLPVLIIAPFVWPFGLVMVWTSRGPASTLPTPEQPAIASMPPMRTPMKPSADPENSWRVGHTGRDCMYYEERIDDRWQRLEISGEMLMGPTHHVIYFASNEAWNQFPEWARGRRPEIIQRIKSAFRAPEYEYHGA